jgi:HEPN domain-containing protein
MADADYIAARMAFRADLMMQYLWASQQALEKYLKSILLFNRIPARNVKHDLEAGLTKINSSGKLLLDLTKGTQEFIDYIDTYGRFRYFETSPYGSGVDIIKLDRAIWEIRRYCTLSQHQRQVKLKDGEPPPIVRIAGGYLEKVIDKAEHPARSLCFGRTGFLARVRERLFG